MRILCVLPGMFFIISAFLLFISKRRITGSLLLLIKSLTLMRDSPVVGDKGDDIETE